MSRFNRVGSYVFALLIIVSMLATAAWGGGGGVPPGQAVTAAEGDDTVLPPGASQDWWSSVQEQMSQSEYHISWQEGTGLPELAAAYQVPNRAHNLRTYFTESGIQLVPRADSTPSWTFGLTLTGYGYQDNGRPVAAAEMSVEENRADYDRGDVAEWYVNTEEGLKQGFTLNAPPSGPDDQGCALVLQISVSGDLTPALVELEQAIDFTTPGGVRVLRYAGLQVNDAEGNLLDANLGVSEDGLSITMDATTAVFPITVDPVLTTPSWTAEGNQAECRYGWSVATAGDVNGDGYSDVIVGAPRYTNGSTEEGRAYVYLGSAAGLSTSASWTAESNQAYSQFGCSVATAGDVNGDGYSDVIVGAYDYDHDQSAEGMAFVWHGSSSGVNDDIDGTPVNADWTAESNKAGACLGMSVGTAGDVNGDGYSDVIAGAEMYTNDHTAEGMAFVWHGSSSGVNDDIDGTPVNADWTAESNDPNARFGCSVGTAGDVNGDGYADVIIGANTYGSGGGAFVYHGSLGGLSSTPDWTAGGDDASTNLGCSVGTAGDVNGDGYADVIVGDYGYDAGGDDEAPYEGIALVWHGSSSGLGASGSPSNADWQFVGGGSDSLGCSVGTAGDVDGDGYADVIVGAMDYGNGETLEGAVAVFRGSSAGLGTAPAWIQEGNSEAAHLGKSAGTAGDVNGDGYSDVIVGAWMYTNDQTDEGAAAVYCGYASGLMGSWLWGAAGDKASAYFGYSVGTAGDVNGDGYADVIVGARGYTNGESSEGRAYVYLGSATGLSATEAWTAEGNLVNASFGYSVGTAGDVNGDGYADIIIGAPDFTNGQANEGMVFVYYGSASGLGPSGTPDNADWKAESNKVASQFGSSMATAGDVNGDGYSDVIVGALYYDNDGLEAEGSAFVYYGSASGLGAFGTPDNADWKAEGNVAFIMLGYSVSTAGDVNGDGYSDVIVGALYYENGQEDEGGAFVYHGSASGLGANGTPDNADWKAEGDLADAHFGGTVAGAGDVNGDGYSDVIVGSQYYANGQTDEGGAFVYHGSASGLGPNGTPDNADWKAESNLADTHLGGRVAGAGDVNGDGYADVLVTATWHTNGEEMEGAAVLWCGSSTGLGASGTPANADWGDEGDQAHAYFGTSAGTAGDVNGDGYADIIIGGQGYSLPETSEGAAFLYYGGGRRGVSLNPRQERSDSSAPIAQLGRSDRSDAFRLTVDPYTPFGRGKAKLQCEVKPLGTAFNGTGLRESSIWTSTTSDISYLVDGLSGNTNYHWRVRLHYSPATTPFQQYSRWVTMPWNGWQEADLRTANTPPAVTTNDADEVTTTSARLNGTLTSRGSASSVTVSFEYGTTSGGLYTAVAAGTLTAPGTFSASIGSLTAGAKYYFQAKAVGIGTAYGDEKSFTAGTTPPTVTTIDASNVSATSATLNGNLAVMGTATSVAVSFEYATTSGGPYTTVSVGDMTTTGDFSADISGLTPYTPYYFQAVATGAGTDHGDEKTFTTSTAPPIVTTNDATNVTASSATLNGYLDSPGSAASVTVSFEYGTTSGGSYTPVAVAEGVKTAPGAFSAEISGMTSSALYYFRAKAEGDGTVYGLEKSFTAGTTPPAVTTSDATYVTNTYARLNGSLTSLGGAGSVAVSFEYATASGGPYTTVDAGTMTANGDFSFNLSGLTTGTPYYFRAKSVGAGTAYGEEKTFTTSTTADETAPSTPQVTDDGESTENTTAIHAAWSASDPESGIVEYSYAVGTTAGGNDVLDWTSAGTAAEKTVTGLSLTPGQTYYISVKALNGQGLWSEIGSSDGITVAADDGEPEPGGKGGTPFWVWILVALGLVGVGAGGLVFWRSRKTKRT